MKWKIIKRYGHAEGLSATFKQWRAPETHCRFLHGYALGIEVCFEGDDLDDRNWLISFGDLKPFKEYLKDMFDHKTLVASDDPDLVTMFDLEDAGIIQMKIVESVGCEAFAKMIYEWLDIKMHKFTPNNLDEWGRSKVRVKYVKVQEHEGNTAVYEPDDLGFELKLHRQVMNAIREEENERAEALAPDEDSWYERMHYSNPPTRTNIPDGLVSTTVVKYSLDDFKKNSWHTMNTQLTSSYRVGE